MQNKQKGFVGVLVVAIIAMLIVGGGGYYMYKRMISRQVPEIPKDKSQINFDDSDLRISFTRIPDSENSFTAFNKIKTGDMTNEDQDFLIKYIGNFSSKNLPPTAESQKIITKYSDMLKIFNDNAKKSYQCLGILGDECLYTPLRNVTYLAGLQAVDLFRQKKATQAQDAASNITALGRNLIVNADGIIPFVMGLIAMRTGYNIMGYVNPKYKISDEEKASLIKDLRDARKNLTRGMYVFAIDFVDYIDSPEHKTLRPLTADEEDSVVNIWRKGISERPSAWNVNETRKYFYDSYKIALSNIDLDCGVASKESKIDIGFDIKDEQSENYLGKTLYTTAYASLDALNTRHCEIEALIKKF